MERAKNDVGLIITGICSVDTIIDSWYWNHPPMYFGKGGYNEYARILKQHVNVPIILAGRMDDPEMANAAIGDCCDIVSYGRPLLADPEYVTKIRYGREEIYGLQPALRKKNILVIGGGVGGMEAARVAALRGHKVTLVEKSDRLGGNLIPGGMPECKHYDHELIRYYERQLELLGVEKRQAVMIGDQVFTDVLGANRCGIANILVRYLRRDGETKIGIRRRVEKAVLWLYRCTAWRRGKLVSAVKKGEDSCASTKTLL